MMRIKYLFYSFILLISFTGVLRAQADLSFQETSFDFGVVKPGTDTLWHDFVFVNKGMDPLVIKSVNTSCDCTLAEWPKGRTIQPGQKAIIKGGFKIVGKSGPFDKSIIIIANTTPATTFLTIKGDIKE
jgi:hypothetical protein